MIMTIRHRVYIFEDAARAIEMRRKMNLGYLIRGRWPRSVSLRALFTIIRHPSNQYVCHGNRCVILCCRLAVDGLYIVL